eukprot:gnl/Spiro4/7727_TR4068_c0_g1_i1.p1 gnl/Spiro4/7727_TR4068_c0_g1~~gnl/Spiro4/7727_TR4068_c0_g1_i1.p1  ORF type:complete len:152 (-),score=37.86 gnl/Spiro4/7727_TR4068_c0_g1_i1:267-722(-)
MWHELGNVTEQSEDDGVRAVSDPLPPIPNSSLAHIEHKSRRGPNSAVTVAALCASVNSMLLGYDIGVFGGALLFIRAELQLGDVQSELLAGTLGLCAVVGAVVAGHVSDQIGRLNTLIVASSFFLAGAVPVACSSNFAFLLVGRWGFCSAF